MHNDRLTREQVLDVSERFLRDFGWTLHLTAYRTHTGETEVRPWTGPVAWECRARATFQESDELLSVIRTVREMGLDIQLVGGDEDGCQIRVVQPGRTRISE